MPDWQESLVTSSNGASIETRYLPGDPARLAFIAHPFGRLGGTFNDYVVTGLAKHLFSKHNYSVVLLNSRGVGKSTGRASFSAIPEAEDYQSVVNHFANDVQPGSDVLLCGYSAGTLSASYAVAPKQSHARYLLISYPATVVWALTLFRSTPFNNALQRITSDQKTPVLSIRGTEDQFMPSASYDKWEKALTTPGEGSSITCRTVEGAEHFWRGKGHIASLLEYVDGWLERTR